MRGSLWKYKFPEKFQHASEARKKKNQFGCVKWVRRTFDFTFISSPPRWHRGGPRDLLLLVISPAQERECVNEQQGSPAMQDAAKEVNFSHTSRVTIGSYVTGIEVT